MPTTGDEFEELRKLYSELIKQSLSAGLVDLQTLRISLELSTLAMVNLIKDEDMHQKRLVKCNTGIVYRQQKYNLEREETEGYSKLVLLLKDLQYPPADVSVALQHIFSAIGHFDLEPNRVLDIILDCFEEQVDNLSYLTLLRHFKVANIVHIVGFKLAHYQQPTPAPPTTTIAADAATTATASTISAAATTAGTSASTITEFHVVPQSLCALCATLIAHALIDVSDLLPYLQPTLEDTAIWLRDKEKVTRKALSSLSGLNDFFNSNTSNNTTTPSVPTSSTLLPASSGFLAAPLEHRLGPLAKRISTSELVNSNSKSTSKPSQSENSSGSAAPPVPPAPTLNSNLHVGSGASNKTPREREREARERERLRVRTTT